MEIKAKGTPVTMDEAVAYTGLKKSYLYKLTCQGQIPYYKPNGGRIFFTHEDLDAYIFRGRRSASYELAEEADKRLAGRGDK